MGELGSWAGKDTDCEVWGGHLCQKEQLFIASVDFAVWE